MQLKQGEQLEVSDIYDSLQPLNSGLGGKLLSGWLSLSQHLQEAELHLDQFSEEDHCVSTDNPMPEQTGSRAS